MAWNGFARRSTARRPGQNRRPLACHEWRPRTARILASEWFSQTLLEDPEMVDESVSSITVTESGEQDYMLVLPGKLVRVFADSMPRADTPDGPR